MLGIWPVAGITSWAGMEVPSLRTTENVERVFSVKNPRYVGYWQ